MPMYPVNDFLADFIQILECKRRIIQKVEDKNKLDHQIQLDEFLRLANESLGSDAMENKITVTNLYHVAKAIGRLQCLFFFSSDNQIPDSRYAFGTAE